uniref:Prostaglandin E2 receptor EP4 subtype-like n=1 Tax=Poecilia latipinna TaxID=48699 RepID=A0A3B3VK04_9TELE
MRSQIPGSFWPFLVMETPNFTHGSAPVNESLCQQRSGNSTEIALPIFMFACGAIGNLIAILVLSVSRQEKKSSAFFSLVRGLAVTDLLGTCMASPFTIANYLGHQVLLDPKVCEFDSFLLLFFGLTGLSIIGAMAAERYLAICWPYRYQRWGVNRRSAQKFLLFIYISHILFCCLPMMGVSRSELQPSGTWCFIDWKTSEPLAATYSVLYGVVSLMLILGTIVLNLAVCGTLLLMRRRTAHRPATRASVRQRWRALSSAAETQMMTVLVMTSAVVLIRIFANRFQSDQKADLRAIRIASLNPILDPWIYILLRRSLFRRLLSRSGRCDSPVSASPPSPHSDPPRFPETTKENHVFAQLMCNANIITQLPASVRFPAFSSDFLYQT